jgi:hypothetical protein
MSAPARLLGYAAPPRVGPSTADLWTKLWERL